jgi:hypothetical protein
MAYLGGCGWALQRRRRGCRDQGRPWPARSGSRCSGRRVLHTRGADQQPRFRRIPRPSPLERTDVDCTRNVDEAARQAALGEHPPRQLLAGPPARPGPWGPRKAVYGPDAWRQMLGGAPRRALQRRPRVVIVAVGAWRLATRADWARGTARPRTAGSPGTRTARAARSTVVKGGQAWGRALCSCGSEAGAGKGRTSTTWDKRGATPTKGRARSLWLASCLPVRWRWLC